MSNPPSIPRLSPSTLNPPDFLRSDGQSTARGRRYTSAPGQAIVRVPEYAACGRSARPLTQDRPMSHEEQHPRLPANAGGARTRHEAGSRVRKARRHRHPSPVPSGEGLSTMRRNQVAVVGAAETTELGVIPNVSQIQLHADAALNAIADAGLKLSDIDGFATAVETPQQIAHYLGITPTWVDGTSVGGCSFMLHVRHAAAAIEAGLCKTVLITHAESGKS